MPGARPFSCPRLRAVLAWNGVPLGAPPWSKLKRAIAETLRDSQIFDHEDRGVTLIAIEDTDVLEVSTPELEDVVRLEDRYGRSP